MLHVLFLCSQNRMRSPTAERVFCDYPGIECASAGLGLWPDKPVTPELVAWAELILVMDPEHLELLRARFAPQLAGKRVECLGIPDVYEYMDPELVRLLKRKVTPFLPKAGPGQ